MDAKTFNRVTATAMVVTLTAAVLSMVGVVITGFYPGIVVLCALALIPIGSRLYAGRSSHRSGAYSGNQFTALTIINLLAILVVVWMVFVILVDRVFSKVL